MQQEASKIARIPVLLCWSAEWQQSSTVVWSTRQIRTLHCSSCRAQQSVSLHKRPQVIPLLVLQTKHMATSVVSAIVPALTQTCIHCRSGMIGFVPIRPTTTSMKTMRQVHVLQDTNNCPWPRQWLYPLHQSKQQDQSWSTHEESPLVVEILETIPSILTTQQWYQNVPLFYAWNEWSTWPRASFYHPNQ